MKRRGKRQKPCKRRGVAHAKSKHPLPAEYERRDYGPISVERIGRLTCLSSHWDNPDEHRRFMEHVSANRPHLKADIDTKIQRILAIFSQADPLELLATVATRNCLANAETYRESTHEGTEAYAEYALSLALSQTRGSTLHSATETEIDEVNRLIDEVFKDVFWYFLTESAEGKRPEIEDEFRSLSIARYLGVRGESYPEHQIEMVRDLFGPHDRFFVDCYGFSVEDAISTFVGLEDSFLEGIRTRSSVFRAAEKLWRMQRDFVKQHARDKSFSDEEVAKEFRALPSVREILAAAPSDWSILGENPFRVDVPPGAHAGVIRMLSTQFGENQGFRTFERTPGWPTNDSTVYRRPLIECDGWHYIFVPQILFRNMGGILESWIEAKDRAYYLETYQESRGKYLERKGLEHLQKLLPGCEVHRNLHYQWDSHGETIRGETDGLILYDDNLLIVEAKAGNLSVSARRGGLDRMRHDMDELVRAAYLQAARTMRYISETERPVFEDRSGSLVFELVEKEKYRNVYLLNVTLTDLKPFSTNVQMLQEFGLMQADEWVWSVFINDLRVIAEIAESPSEFLLYLQRRIRASQFPEFRSQDELDLFGCFLEEGLYPEGGGLQDFGRLYLHGYAEPIDRYYDHLAGRVSSGERPRFAIPDGLRTLVGEIERTGKYGFSRVSTELLGAEHDSHAAIVENIHSGEQRLLKSGRGRAFELRPKDGGCGFTFLMALSDDTAAWSGADRRARDAMHATGCSEWFTICLKYKEDGGRVVDFQSYRSTPAGSAATERAEVLGAPKAQGVKPAVKVGRNSPCPCGSGLKYKRCCGR